MYNIIPSFLTWQRLSSSINKLLKTPEYILYFIVLNSPVFYKVYHSSFEPGLFLFSYVYCGGIQGIINSVLYYISDVFFFGKLVGDEWKQTKFYDVVIQNSDAAYLYILGTTVYTSCTILPKTLQWTFVFPGYANMLLQLFYVSLLHDGVFTFIHYWVHKVSWLRISHLKWHHECPFHIGNSRCALAASGLEALIRDLYSAFIPTYIIGFCGIPFYAHNWIIYYSLYSFWAMYVHTGKNKYHLIHHTTNSFSNYGLYYLTDYMIGTLRLK